MVYQAALHKAMFGTSFFCPYTIVIMRRPIIISGLALLATVCIAQACKKDVLETQYTRIEGKWKLTRQALDDNADGAIQTNEIHAVDSSIDDEIQFNKDKTGVETVTAGGFATPYSFTYSIGAGNIIQRIGVGYDTINYYLFSVSSSDLELTVNAPSGLAAYFYQKK